MLDYRLYHIHYGEHIGIFNLQTMEMTEYDVKDDIRTLPNYGDLETINYKLPNLDPNADEYKSYNKRVMLP